MNDYQGFLNELTARAWAGDDDALGTLRQELEGQMVPMVRLALCDVGPASFREQVRTTARQLARYLPGNRPPDRERLVRRVASCLCDAVCDRVRALRPAGQRMQETVPA